MIMYLGYLLAILLVLEKHLNFEASCSDDCYSTSTDRSSLWSCDSESVGGTMNPTTTDCISLNSADYTDSAICSPQSLSLDRKLSDCLKSCSLEPSTPVFRTGEASPPDSQLLVDDGDNQDVVEDETEDVCRGRTGTLLATS